MNIQTVKAIKWSVDKKGEITPVIICSSHNNLRVLKLSIPELQKYGIERGSTLDLKEVNGKLEIVSNLGNINPHVELPQICPCCGAKVKSSSAAGRKCTNRSCPVKQIRKFERFASTVNIAALTPEILEILLGNGFIQSFPDLYYLDQYKKELLDYIDNPVYHELIVGIDHSRNINFSNFLMCLNIPELGKKECQTIANCMEFEEFETVVMETDFTELFGFTDSKNQNIHSWFADQENMTLWHDLRGCIGVLDEKLVRRMTKLTGRTVAVTGSFENYINREYLEQELYSMGAYYSSIVTKNTDYLILGDNPGSKLEKAQDLGIPTIREQEFVKIVNSAVKRKKHVT